MTLFRDLQHGPIGQRVRKHRRVLAAALAGLAVLFGLGSVHSAATPVPSAAVWNSARALGSGKVAIPVPLANPATAGVLRIGDVIDLLAVSDAGTASTIARDAQVMEIPAAGGFMTSTGALILVGVDELTALRIAGASGTSDLTYVLKAAQAPS